MRSLRILQHAISLMWILLFLAGCDVPAISPTAAPLPPGLPEGCPPGCSGVDLSGAELQGVDLSGTNLSNAKLGEVRLRGAKLHGADLRYADLHGADLRATDLRAADLGLANLRQADLSGANLSGANLFFADLRNADLHGADLSKTYLVGANLRGADLSEAKVTGVDLGDADLQGAVSPSPAPYGSGACPSLTNMAVDIVAVADSWLDQNQNGTWDEGEPPLPGVRIYLHLTWGGRTVTQAAELTNNRGEAVIYTGYSIGKVVRGLTPIVYPDTPPGYRLTTAGRLRLPPGGGIAQFGFAPGLQSTPTPTVQEAPTLTPPPRDCDYASTAVTHSAIARSWIDENGNSIWDKDEPAFPGVTISLDSVWPGDEVITGSARPTDEKGRVILSASFHINEGWFPLMLVVSPAIPPGYRLTTAEQLELDRWYTEARPRLQFGFAPDGTLGTD